jgi:hypothetical protein
MGILSEGITVRVKPLLAAFVIVTLECGALSRGQDLPPDTETAESPQRTPSAPATHFKFTEAKEGLRMLEQIAAANEAILGKQRETLMELADLSNKAGAAKASSARSTSRGTKK